MIETNTSKNYRQHETEFKKIYQKIRYYCSSTGECKAKNRVFVFKNENDFYTYYLLFSKIEQRDRVKLDYEKKSDNQGLTYTTGKGYFRQEVDFLIENGFKFIKDGIFGKG